MPSGLVFPPRVSTPFIQQPDGWDTAWRAAKAASGSAQARIAIIGDSDSSGYGTTNWWTKRWSSLLRTQLLAKYTAGSGADFIPSHYNVDYAFLPGTVPFVHNGATAMAPVGGGFSRAMYYPAAATNTAFLTFVTPYACTDLDIHYVDAAASASWGYTVDGGTQRTVTLPSVVTSRQNKISITGLANTTHTIVFNNSSANAALILIGISTFATAASRTTGIGIVNAAISGGAAGDWMVTSGFPADMVAQWMGTYGGWGISASTNANPTVVTLAQTPTVPLTSGIYVNITGSNAAGLAVNTATNNGFWPITVISPTTFSVAAGATPGAGTAAGTVYAETGFGWPTAPDLVIIELGGNDMLQALGVELFWDALRRLCSACRRAKPNCSIMFISTNLPDGQTSDVRLKPANGDAWVLYCNVLRQVAALYNAAIYDIYADIGPTGFAEGYQSQGDYHLTDAGHQHVADMLSPVIV